MSSTPPTPSTPSIPPTSPTSPHRRLPLADLRVIDLSSVLAGPNCARYLADFGADVIKVERPDGGDSLRTACVA